MALDATAKKVNFLFSLKKYIIDNIYANEHILPVFDVFLPPSKEIDQWITIIPGPLKRDTVSDFSADIYCVTRKDYEGLKLVELLDTIAGYFAGDPNQTDGIQRIPFYDSSIPIVLSEQSESTEMYLSDDEGNVLIDTSDGLDLTVNVETVISETTSMIVTKCEEGETLDAPDQSKFVILSITLKMASKI